MEEKLVDLSEFEMSDEELFSHVDISEIQSEKITAPRYSYWKSVARVFFKKKINIIMLAILGILILFAYIYPVIFPSDLSENVLDLESFHLSPSEAIAHFGYALKWIFGTGTSGESTFNAMWYGARISISLAFICAAINMTVGVIVGAIWGFSKKVDRIMTEVYNVLGNIPYVLLISVLVMIMSASFWTMVFALTITGWLSIAYFIRTQVIIIRDREYNLASRCLGTSIFKITMKNVLPFMVSIIVTLLAAEIPSYISYEVFLSYIGMGLSDMSLGKLIERAQSYMTENGWEFWAPVAVASIITIVLYVVGQNLGDAADPRTHM